MDFGDVNGMADALSDLIGDSVRRNRMRKSAYEYGRTMVWREVGRQYVEMFRGCAPRERESRCGVCLEAEDAASNYSSRVEARSSHVSVR